MLNGIWVGIVALAILCGALNGKLDQVSSAITDSATGAVTLALGLVGSMALWLGLVKVLHAGGLLHTVARGLRPLLVRLFPDVPVDHPAMSMMILNMTSNMLGLGNAATPFGLKAMAELDKLNRTPGTATNSMSLFLAINTSGLAVFPTGMIALRASLGSREPASILVTSVITTVLSTLTAIVVCKLTQSLWALPVPTNSAPPNNAGDAPQESLGAEPQAGQGKRALALILGFVLLLAFGFAAAQRARDEDGGLLVATHALLVQWPLVLLVGAIIIFGIFKGVAIYDVVVDGGKEGFQMALRIIPFLVAMLVAVGMFRASGGLDLLVSTLSPVTALLGMPAEALPMALLRPLSGNGAFALSAELMKAHGPDTLVGTIVATMQGSTETTFYVLALYFGCVRVTRARHTLIPCLTADLVGALASVWTCRLLLG